MATWKGYCGRRTKAGAELRKALGVKYLNRLPIKKLYTDSWSPGVIKRLLMRHYRRLFSLDARIGLIRKHAEGLRFEDRRAMLTQARRLLRPREVLLLGIRRLEENLVIAKRRGK